MLPKFHDFPPYHREFIPVFVDIYNNCKKKSFLFLKMEKSLKSKCWTQNKKNKSYYSYMNFKLII